MKVLRTKIIAKSDEKRLQSVLNEFLETMERIEDVKEIQYQFSDGWFSVMVIYYDEIGV